MKRWVGTGPAHGIGDVDDSILYCVDIAPLLNVCFRNKNYLLSQGLSGIKYLSEACTGAFLFYFYVRLQCFVNIWSTFSMQIVEAAQYFVLTLSCYIVLCLYWRNRNIDLSCVLTDCQSTVDRVGPPKSNECCTICEIRGGGGGFNGSLLNGLTCSLN